MKIYMLGACFGYSTTRVYFLASFGHTEISKHVCNFTCTFEVAYELF